MSPDTWASVGMWIIGGLLGLIIMLIGLWLRGLIRSIEVAITTAMTTMLTKVTDLEADLKTASLGTLRAHERLDVLKDQVIRDITELRTTLRLRRGAVRALGRRIYSLELQVSSQFGLLRQIADKLHVPHTEPAAVPLPQLHPHHQVEEH